MASSPSIEQFPQAAPFGQGQTPMVWASEQSDNCQVGVFMGYVADESMPLDFQLSLPQEWIRDEQRRQECHVPPEMHYQTPGAMFEMLDVACASPTRLGHGDDEPAAISFRALRERSERYAGVPCTTTMRDLEALPLGIKAMVVVKATWQSVTAWRHR
jgi:hypothetical protein